MLWVAGHQQQLNGFFVIFIFILVLEKTKIKNHVVFFIVILIQFQLGPIFFFF
jgi:hypothetical protein